MRLRLKELWNVMRQKNSQRAQHRTPPPVPLPNDVCDAVIDHQEDTNKTSISQRKKRHSLSSTFSLLMSMNLCRFFSLPQACHLYPLLVNHNAISIPQIYLTKLVKLFYPNVTRDQRRKDRLLNFTFRCSH